MILVTGSNGFIGGNVIRRVSKKTEVAAMDINPGNKKEHVSNIICDIRIKNAVTDICSFDVDKIVHSASIISPKLCMLAPHLAYMTNIIGTLNVLEMARKKDVKKFVYISTGGVYRNGLSTDTITEEWPTNPSGFYAISKLTSEYTIAEFSKNYGIPAVALRITAPYGRGMIKPETRIGIPDALHRHTLLFAMKALRNEDIIMPYGGDHTVNYTYVEDIIDGVESALNSELKGFENFNITSGRLLTIRELGNAFGRINNKIKVNIGPGDLTREDYTGDPLLARLSIKQGRFDITKAKNMLGYNPSRLLDDGLKDLIDYLKDASIMP